MSRGIQRERAVRDLLAKQDWLAFRAPASLGVADVIALRDGSRPRLIEVKSTAGGPYEHFGPADRERLAFAARLAGADAFLAWWPPRGKLRWIAEEEWPPARNRNAAGTVNRESPSLAARAPSVDGATPVGRVLRPAGLAFAGRRG